ncbi:MAG TPA: Holliday junction resolvase RuvX, partial [Mycobacteriales bacterium]|nr:Holliday junction resolvase RuvX [Mycobacteriales bacterium]
MPAINGVCVGVDVGSVRVGVAVSDPAGILATPWRTLRRGQGDLDAIVELVAERAAAGVVVGLPMTLAGRSGPAVQEARAYAELLRERIDPVPVHLYDERFTTSTASRDLSRRGISTRAQRAIIDQAAA